MEEDQQQVLENNIQSQRESDTRDKFILVAIIITAFTSIYWFLLAKYVDATAHYEVYDSLVYFGYLVSLGMAAVPVLVALGVKSSRWRGLALAFGITCAVIRIYWLIKSMMPVEELEFFEF